jgi:YbbR domain-containing protein
VVVSDHIMTEVELQIDSHSTSFLFYPSSKKAKIYLRGPSHALKNFINKSTIASYPLSHTEFSPNERIKRFTIATKDFLKLPPDIYLVDAQPEKIVVTVFRAEVRSLQVIPRIHIDYGDHLAMKELKITPSFVMAKVPSLLMPQEQVTYTENVVIDNANKAGKYSVNVSILDEINDIPVEYLQKEQNFLVEFQLESVASKTVSLEIKKVHGLQEMAKPLQILDNIPAEVTIVGPQKKLEKIDLVTGYINIADIDNKSKVPLKLFLLDGIEIKTALPHLVEIKQLIE